MKKINNTVLITGGASGIGFALAKKLVKQKNTVIVVGRDEKKLHAAKAEIPQLITLKADISCEQDRQSLVKIIMNDYPKLNYLINNAGIQIQTYFDKDQPPLKQIEKEMDVNFIGPVRLTSLLIPTLKKQKEAKVINISSGLAIVPKKDTPIYCASKAALSIFSMSLGYQLENSSIRVIDVKTPLIDTNMTKGRGKGKISPDVFANNLLKKIQKGKVGEIRIGKVKILYFLYRFFPYLAYKIMK
ncbi:SDR family NAD(P)-dependent oxidoreductase [Evansella sp. AB-P1]|uniref:SDR family oxidoreductase n=1 Tax=Evansella sp. AB-P1 TaxID=3037653 RepID=UPI00241CA19B|nr:SDR family NAD(P)-dependent oxidoreductase [Evansella sp. AB-P1]MDG5786142.1 SDR family NAD(P)-dependent oxidoreductase [Evansella sp. AB-P1]